MGSLLTILGQYSLRGARMFRDYNSNHNVNKGPQFQATNKPFGGFFSSVLHNLQGTQQSRTLQEQHLLKP